ncbi:hypothetical protein KSP40_PGU020021 [Platanthera guangdongensis]|uniref:RING-type E3 ubiquitin transferase n=1 Tax=Platanthera guangdongensis TaxID=2320717 RepID=A0ABR2N4F2_9ASPA
MRAERRSAAKDDSMGWPGLLHECRCTLSPGQGQRKRFLCRDADVLKSVTRINGGTQSHIAEQHFLKHNDAGSWIQDSALMLSMCKEVPWYISQTTSPTFPQPLLTLNRPNDGSGRVLVVGARSAAGLVLTVASEVFEESGRSLVRGTLDYLQGLKMLGVKRIERVLPTGTSLTVVAKCRWRKRPSNCDNGGKHKAKIENEGEAEVKAHIERREGESKGGGFISREGGCTCGIRVRGVGEGNCRKDQMKGQ